MPNKEEFIYITSLSFPARFANQIQVLSMARAFSRLLDDKFLFVCSGEENDDLVKIRHRVVNPPFFRSLLSVYYYFLWMPFFLISHRRNQSGPVLYFKDTRLAAYALLWKNLFFRNIRVVMESHVPFPFDQYVFTRADHIVTITSSMAEIIKNRHNIPPQKISVLPNGIDLEKFDPGINRAEARAAANLPLNKKIALYSGSVGFYKNWKGEDVFIETAKVLPDFLFVILGGDSNDAEKSVGHALTENVLCMGRKPHDQVPLYLKAADVLVLPNKKGNKISDELTSPVKLFEYMASGTPIIASDLPSIREVLNDANALLIKPNDPKVLADSIMKIIQNKKLADNLAKRAKTDVKKYEWSTRAKRVLEILNGS